MDIRLSLLMSALLGEVVEKYGITARKPAKDGRTWHLTSEDQEKLLSAISAEFVATGLRPDSEPNSRGLQLEELLDYINRARSADDDQDRE